MAEFKLCSIYFGPASLDRNDDLLGGDRETPDPGAQGVVDRVGHHRDEHPRFVIRLLLQGRPEAYRAVVVRQDKSISSIKAEAVSMSYVISLLNRSWVSFLNIGFAAFSLMMARNPSRVIGSSQV